MGHSCLMLEQQGDAELAGRKAPVAAPVLERPGWRLPSQLLQCFTCLPFGWAPRRQQLLAQPQRCQALNADGSEAPSSRSAAMRTATAQTPGLIQGSRPFLPLDVGFALVELLDVKLPDRAHSRSHERAYSRSHELRLTVRSEAPTEAGFKELFDFMELILKDQQVCTGFMLTFNFEDLGWLQMDIVMQIICWSSEPSRQAKWEQRCLCWKIVIPDGIYFQAARLALNCTLFFSPPSCIVYLVRGPAEELGDEGTICYQPENSDNQGIELLSDLHFRCAEVQSQRAMGLPFTSDDSFGSRTLNTELDKSTQGNAVLNAQTESEGACIPAQGGGTDGELPASIDVGFCELGQGFDEARDMGFLKIIARDADVTNEGLSEMMLFMDGFVSSPSAAGGFSITYDFRSLRTPSMAMVSRVASWGGEPVRKETWQRLNLVCRIVVNAGVRFTMAQGVLSAFFYLCPPVCKTYLVSDPDQADEDSVVFEPTRPSAPPPAERPGARSGARGVAEASARGELPILH